MALVLVLAFVGGLLTGLSPCIVPVLPVILAGSATGGRRRPYAIIGGLVASFTLFTLVAGALLRLLHLPQDFLRDFGVVLLLLLAVGLLVPAVGDLLERPFARLSGVTAGAGRLGEGREGIRGGLLLGAGLGLVFVPCAGPVLSAITVAAARQRYGVDLVLVTLAYAAGVAVPLLVVAVFSNRASAHWGALRRHVPLLRRVAGVVIALTAVAIYFNLTTGLQTSIPGTSSLENRVEGSLGATSALQALQGEKHNTFAARSVAAGSLPDLGRAPNFTGITAWINTPGGHPLSLASLRGKVVLVDFWTYSCINCLRSLPHVEAWYRTYHDDGFVVVGVHSPEFPFEHVVANVQGAVARLGVHYPVAVDDNLDTWTAFNNEYWPAEYLIDQNGQVRHTQFGEGDYSTTESDIRLLLEAGAASAGHPRSLPPATDVADKTPTDPTTPESYLGYERLANAVGTPVVDDRPTTYHPVSPVPADQLTFGGTWTVHSWEATAGSTATLGLNYNATDVYLVLGGSGTVAVRQGGVLRQTVPVSGLPDIYTLVSGTQPQSGTLELTFSPGVQAYDFTFG